MAQEYVIMPAEDYQAACDAVRAKTGGIEAIKSGDLASEIGRIAGDGELVDKEITANGLYVASNEGVPGYSRVSVSVPTDAVMKPLRAEENGKVYLPEDYDADGFYSVFVNVPTDGMSSGGSVMKTGTTTSATIDTGLSEIEYFFMYKETVTTTGLIMLTYNGTNTLYLHANQWATTSYGSKNVMKGQVAATVNGGSITVPGTSQTSGALSSGVTYNWVAFGKE